MFFGRPLLQSKETFFCLAITNMQSIYFLVRVSVYEEHRHTQPSLTSGNWFGTHPCSEKAVYRGENEFRIFIILILIYIIIYIYIIYIYIFFFHFNKSIKGQFQTIHRPNASSPNRAYLYCFLVSYLPALVSRIFVANTRTMFTNSRKFSWKTTEGSWVKGSRMLLTKCTEGGKPRPCSQLVPHPNSTSTVLFRQTVNWLPYNNYVIQYNCIH